jgi:phosphatidylserine decarboxylase
MARGEGSTREQATPGPPSSSKRIQGTGQEQTRFPLLFNAMFHQIPNKKPYKSNPAGKGQIRDHDQMLHLINHILTSPPAYSKRDHQAGLVGLPFYAIFVWPMGTPSGFAVVQDAQVNTILKKVLNEW